MKERVKDLLNLTKEDRELLSNDICSRLLHKVKLSISDEKHPLMIDHYSPYNGMLYAYEYDNTGKIVYGFDICAYRPFLRPISSMSDEEKTELSNVTDSNICWYHEKEDLGFCLLDNGSTIRNNSLAISWLNANHFDYRGLIERGLAIKAPDGMYKKQ